MSRESGLTSWVKQQLPQMPALEMQSLSGDASFRRYFRVQTGQASLIAVDAPPEKEKNREFVKVARHLAGYGVRVPEVMACDYQQGYLLLSDLGDQLLLPLLVGADTDLVHSYYQSVLMQLLKMQLSTSVDIDLPGYTPTLLHEEMSLFPQWFAKGLLAYTPSSSEQVMLEQVFQLLINSAGEQPQMFVHRDYHSRNIMLNQTGDLATIDFQDAVIGPLTYDLVSLLRDCYVAWPQELVRGWALDYFDLAQQQGLLQGVEQDRFLRWFDLMGLQRHIKVLGIFARLYLRDGKDAYLADLPLVVRYTLSVADNYPQLAEFCAWFRACLLPLIEKQDWWVEGEQ
jgi:hypothetical protein